MIKTPVKRRAQLPKQRLQWQQQQQQQPRSNDLATQLGQLSGVRGAIRWSKSLSAEKMDLAVVCDLELKLVV